MIGYNMLREIKRAMGEEKSITIHGVKVHFRKENKGGQKNERP